MTSTVLSFTARARTSAAAEATANAVAASYLAYVGSSTSPVGHVAGRVLAPAVTATGTSPVVHLLSAGLIGAIAGTLIGIIVALATRRNDRALRERDQIANSIGVPVLASLPVDHPSDPAGWVKLLDDYQPDAVGAWHLRKALQYLRVSGLSPGRATATATGRRRYLAQRDFPLLRHGSARSRSAAGRIRRFPGHPHHLGHRSRRAT